MKLTPLHGPVLTDKAARLLELRIEAATDQRIRVRVLVLQIDCDLQAAAEVRRRARDWVRRHRLKLPVAICAPAPCLERWLCRCEELVGKSAPTSAPCQGWKKAWERGRGVDLDRVRAAARSARDRLSGLPDFDDFSRDWRALASP